MVEIHLYVHADLAVHQLVQHRLEEGLESGLALLLGLIFRMVSSGGRYSQPMPMR